MKSLCLLGATGSIGDSTLDVVRQHPEKFAISALAANSSWEKTAALAREFDVKKLTMWDPASAEKLSKEIGLPVYSGMDGLLQLIEESDADCLLNALVGSVGCLPTIKAIELGMEVALANKETLVMAGPVIAEKLKDHPQSALVPIDSEHNAIFQCLAGRPSAEIEQLQLTASGGPFRELPAEEFAQITVERALKHPTWSMGPKITIDSATLMNKGLEVIEAHYLFEIPFEQIQVVVHPQSIVHSLVQFRDGSLMAQLGAPDMKIPILYALSHPERPSLKTDRVRLGELGQLQFFAPDTKKFRCLHLAYEAGKAGGTAPAVLNAANEILVAAFLENKIGFLDIPAGIEEILSATSHVSSPDLQTILEHDRQTRVKSQEWIRKRA